jgi:hypothetical protein
LEENSSVKLRSNTMVWGPVIAAGASMLGGMLTRKGDSAPSVPDITSQLNAAKALRQKQGRAVQDTYAKLPSMNEDYSNQTSAGIEDIRNRVNEGTNQYLGDMSKNTEATKDALRRSLYGETFSGVPAAMQAVREAGAAGAGVGSGAYLRGVEGVGESLASKLAQGEQNIQAQGLQSEADARSTAYNTFSNLESKLGTANLDRITKVMDTGRADELSRLALEMGLNSEETQSLIDLMNFQASGKLASESAASQNKNDLSNTLLGIGGNILGNYLGKK